MATLVAGTVGAVASASQIIAGAYALSRRLLELAQPPNHRFDHGEIHYVFCIQRQIEALIRPLEFSILWSQHHDSFTQQTIWSVEDTLRRVWKHLEAIAEQRHSDGRTRSSSSLPFTPRSHVDPNHPNRVSREHHPRDHIPAVTTANAHVATLLSGRNEHPAKGPSSSVLRRATTDSFPSLPVLRWCVEELNIATSQLTLALTAVQAYCLSDCLSRQQQQRLKKNGFASWSVKNGERDFSSLCFQHPQCRSCQTPLVRSNPMSRRHACRWKIRSHGGIGGRNPNCIRRRNRTLEWAKGKTADDKRKTTGERDNDDFTSHDWRTHRFDETAARSFDCHHSGLTFSGGRITERCSTVSNISLSTLVKAVHHIWRMAGLTGDVCSTVGSLYYYNSDTLDSRSGFRTDGPIQSRSSELESLDALSDDRYMEKTIDGEHDPESFHRTQTQVCGGGHPQRPQRTGERNESHQKDVTKACPNDEDQVRSFGPMRKRRLKPQPEREESWRDDVDVDSDTLHNPHWQCVYPRCCLRVAKTLQSGLNGANIVIEPLDAPALSVSGNRESQQRQKSQCRRGGATESGRTDSLFRSPTFLSPHPVEFSLKNQSPILPPTVPTGSPFAPSCRPSPLLPSVCQNHSINQFSSTSRRPVSSSPSQPVLDYAALHQQKHKDDRVLLEHSSPVLVLHPPDNSSDPWRVDGENEFFVVPSSPSLSIYHESNLGKTNLLKQANCHTVPPSYGSLNQYPPPIHTLSSPSCPIPHPIMKSPVPSPTMMWMSVPASQTHGPKGEGKTMLRSSSQNVECHPTLRPPPHMLLAKALTPVSLMLSIPPRLQLSISIALKMRLYFNGLPRAADDVHSFSSSCDASDGRVGWTDCRAHDIDRCTNHHSYSGTQQLHKNHVRPTDEYADRNRSPVMGDRELRACAGLGPSVEPLDPVPTALQSYGVQSVLSVNHTVRDAEPTDATLEERDRGRDAFQFRRTEGRAPLLVRTWNRLQSPVPSSAEDDGLSDGLDGVTTTDSKNRPAAATTTRRRRHEQKLDLLRTQDRTHPLLVWSMSKDDVAKSSSLGPSATDWLNKLLRRSVHRRRHDHQFSCYHNADVQQHESTITFAFLFDSSPSRSALLPWSQWNSDFVHCPSPSTHGQNTKFHSCGDHKHHQRSTINTASSHVDRPVQNTLLSIPFIPPLQVLYIGRLCFLEAASTLSSGSRPDINLFACDHTEDNRQTGVRSTNNLRHPDHELIGFSPSRRHKQQQGVWKAEEEKQQKVESHAPHVHHQRMMTTSSTQHSSIRNQWIDAKEYRLNGSQNYRQQEQYRRIKNTRRDSVVTNLDGDSLSRRPGASDDIDDDGFNVCNRFENIWAKVSDEVLEELLRDCVSGGDCVC